MPNSYGVSDEELNRIREQTARRAQVRKEFQKQKTNPWKHAAEAGYLFDPAIQKFNSMKVSHLEFFQPNRKNALFGICTIVIPMFVYGYALWNERNTREQKIRKGELLYKDRLFKLI